MSTGRKPEHIPLSTLGENEVMRLAARFQEIIDANPHTPTGELTEHFTIDGAAFYRVTPRQWRELMALAPVHIQELNDEPRNVPPDQHPDWDEIYQVSPPLTPAQRIIAHAPEDLDDLLHSIEIVDAWLDDAAPPWAKASPEANRMRRVTKPVTEAIEAYEEMELFHGSNPRKSADPEAYGRMLAEMGDTAFGAILGIQSQTKDIARTWSIFRAAAAKAANRVPFTRGEGS